MTSITKALRDRNFKLDYRNSELSQYLLTDGELAIRVQLWPNDQRVDYMLFGRIDRDPVAFETIKELEVIIKRIRKNASRRKDWRISD